MSEHPVWRKEEGALYPSWTRVESTDKQIKRFVRTWVNANVWDGEDRAEAQSDWTKFTPKDLQSLFEEFTDDFIKFQEKVKT